MNELLWLLLDTIRVTCEQRKNCQGCPCAGMYIDHQGRRSYYCTIYEIPQKWQTDIIRDNLEKMGKIEEGV